MNPFTSWLLVVTLVLASLFGGVYLAHLDAQSVQAASGDAPTPISDNCIEVATVGLLEVFHCETDYGDLYVNSFGFMVVEP